LNGILNRGVMGAVLLALSFCSAAPSAASDVQGKKLLFVLQKAAEPDVVAADELAREHFKKLGFEVSIADQTEPATRADNMDLVVISSSVSGHVLADRYRFTPVPLVTWEAYILDDLRMAGKAEEIDFGTDERERHLWVVNAPHPLAGGLSAGMHNVYLINGAMNWGKPGLGAAIIATLPGQPDRAGVFGYEKGATMDYESLAPARRVFLFLDNVTFGLANEEGLALIDAALKWAAGVTD